MFSLLAHGILTIPLQDDGGFFGFLSGIFGLTFSCIWLFVVIAVIAGAWKIFEKADEAGWKAIIPFYNVWVLCEIVGRPGWWLILWLIPVVNFFIGLILAIDLAKSFDKSTLYGVALFFFPFVFTIILGWGESQYYGPSVGK